MNSSINSFISLFFFFIYVGVSYFILIASSLWTLYFGLELQWMFLSIFIIIGSSVWRGLLNYLVLNSILSTLLISGLLLSNFVLFIYSVLSKVGFFPFILLLSYQYYSSSYVWIFFDLLNKWVYFGSIIFIIYFSFMFSLTLIDWMLLVNFLVVIFFIRFLLTIKHFILISSLQLFLFIICSLYFEDELLCFVYLFYYLISTAYLIWDLIRFNLFFFFDSFYLFCSFSFFLICSSLNSSFYSFLCVNERYINHSSALYLFPFYSSLSFNLFNRINAVRSINLPYLNSSLFSAPLFCFYSIYFIPNFFTDLTSVKELVKLNSILYILYIFYCYAFFPYLMFLLKLFILFSFIFNSLSFMLNLIVYILFILHVFYLRSLNILI